mmetsp:Transcript_749/g.1582  ORF Transcript_749/g.1582 Transcript_749/m.1582 type:complete len:83 (-) Transcript_749:61-309(-)
MRKDRLISLTWATLCAANPRNRSNRPISTDEMCANENRKERNASYSLPIHPLDTKMIIQSISKNEEFEETKELQERSLVMHR